MSPGWAIAQRLIALAALAVMSPVLAGLGLAVRLDSRGPALHRAIRHRPGGVFIVYKLRSMHLDPVPGSAVTAVGDRRVTRIGRLLRRWKLDELPQLWNVVRGDMLLVGPRPEDPRYVDLTDPLHRLVFGAVPGITGSTALAFRDEETILAGEAARVASAAGRDGPAIEDIELAYRERILPSKLEMDATYLRSRSIRGDLVIIARTIGQVLPRTVRR